MSDEELPVWHEPQHPYSGQSGECPKCGHEGSEDHYHRRKTFTRTFGIVPPYIRAEHLRRKCDNCSHVWREFPKDAEEEQADE